MMKLFDEIPYLEGERIILRKLTENDREALSEMAQSNNIYRYEPTYLLEQQYTDMDELLRDLYGKYFEQKQPVPRYLSQGKPGRALRSGGVLRLPRSPAYGQHRRAPAGKILEMRHRH